MRYAFECAYNGSNYQGWQSQPGKPTIQSAIENTLSTLFRSPIIITGCGRTDTGVHATHYIAHFDTDLSLPNDLIYHANAILPSDISLHWIKEVSDNFHARFDAIRRTYQYFIHGYKSPFLDSSSYRIKQFDQLSLEKLQEAANLLLAYESFFPFCLSNSGVQNYEVKLHQAEWIAFEPGRLKFVISANRFLRGMVRLVTGMCINVALGQITLDEVRTSMDNQTILPKSLSLPAHGLYLVKIEYDNL